MKLTKARLRHIIAEEYNRLDEVDTEEAAIATAKSDAEFAARAAGYATAQDAVDKVNGTEDPTLVDRIFQHANEILKLASSMTNMSKRGAIESCINLEKLKGDLEHIEQEGGVPGQEQAPEPDISQSMGGFEIEQP